ncbi:hypothetical protein C8J57DRAFT_1485896 [Mycena rebaudengoi]|nr:hypothetical protein C8J57DRAFT_1485896 [Mycena rebaudengoi]
MWIRTALQEQEGENIQEEKIPEEIKAAKAKATKAAPPRFRKPNNDKLKIRLPAPGQITAFQGPIDSVSLTLSRVSLGVFGCLCLAKWGSVDHQRIIVDPAVGASHVLLWAQERGSSFVPPLPPAQYMYRVFPQLVHDS